MSIIRVLDGPLAKYLPGSGIMLVARSAKAFMDMLANPEPDEQEEVTTFIHECVHHLQVQSSAYLVQDALANLHASESLLFPEEPADRAQAAITLARRRAAFQHRAFGVSCTDLCESVAVLESFKARAREPNVANFLLWRDHVFPGKGNSPYRRTFDIMADLCGNDAAFDLLPVITLIALQGDIPGRSFQMLLECPELQDGSLIGASARDIFTALEFPVPMLFNHGSMARLHPSQRHPTIYPTQMQVLEALGDSALEIFARPHTVLKPPLRGKLMPPVILGSHIQNGDVAVTYGVGSTDAALRQSLYLCTAITAAAAQLVQGHHPHIPCRHSACPNHATHMCSGWFVPPVDPEECGFRAATRAAGSQELYEIGEAFAELQLADTMSALTLSTDLDSHFPTAQVVPDLLEEESFAALYDEKYQIDSVDNDDLVFMVCPECRHSWTRWASKREMRKGFVAVCPHCGHSHEMNEDRGTRIHMD